MAEQVLLITKPKALSSIDKSTLRKSGIIVIETDNPEEIRFVRPSLEINSGDMLYAAMEAAALNTSSREKFTQVMAV